jgi:Glycosyltransferase family 87
VNGRATGQSADPRSNAPLLVATGLVLAAGFALQALAYSHGHASVGSISDIPRLVVGRHLTPGHWPYFERPLEYPVLAGLLLGAAVSVWPGPFGALTVVAVLVGAVTVGVTWLLARRFGARAWRWAIATPLFLYAFQNWDVFAVAAVVVGLLLFERRRDTVAGVAFGLGAAVKLFPLVVVPPLAAWRWANGDRRGARRLVGASVGTFVLVNAPVAALHPLRWWWTYSFQSSRQATWGSAWFYVFRLAGLPVHGTTGAQLANAVSALALLGGLAWLAVRTARSRLDPFAAAGAAVALWILANKVYSPTYDVWLVAFFVMVPLGPRLWVAFCSVDVAVFVVVYGHFDGPVPLDVVRAVLPVLVVLRTAVLITFIARTTARPEPARVQVPALAGSR